MAVGVQGGEFDFEGDGGAFTVLGGNGGEYELGGVEKWECDFEGWGNDGEVEGGGGGGGVES